MCSYRSRLVFNCCREPRLEPRYVGKWYSLYAQCKNKNYNVGLYIRRWEAPTLTWRKTDRLTSNKKKRSRASRIRKKL